MLLAVTTAALIAGCDVPRPGGQVGSPAPEYTAFTLDGEQVTLESLRGEVVLFNVWATWCAPCREEIPELQRLHEQFSARGLRVVGVSVDVGGNDGVKRFADDLGVMYDVLRDPMDRASAVFGFTGIPGTVLISRDGELLWRHVGPVTADDPRLRDALQAAL